VLLLKMLNQLDKIRVTQWLPARKLYTLNTDNVHDLVNQGDSRSDNPSSARLQHQDNSACSAMGNCA
jgi:hypothetical protein